MIRSKSKAKCKNEMALGVHDFYRHVTIIKGLFVNTLVFVDNSSKGRVFWLNHLSRLHFNLYHTNGLFLYPLET